MRDEFVLRLAKEADMDGILYIMEQVKETVEDPAWFVAEDRDYVERHARGEDGFTVVAETADGRLAAFFTIDYPGSREDNLGHDMGFTEEECMHTAHMDIVGVLPEYRGNHLMAKLLEAAEDRLLGRGYRHLMCTIHPDNRYSLKNMTSHGYLVAATKEKYGGLPRHILYKSFKVQSGMEPGTPYGLQEKPVILVSACLLGVNCRYNGKGVLEESVKALMEDAVLIPVCPEIMGGLATPRDPAERAGDRVMTITGLDVTAAYEKGAEETLKLAQLYGCRYAILKERSPSCGSDRIYDRSHSGRLVPGDGVTAELLKKNGIPVFGESKTEDLKRFL